MLDKLCNMHGEISVRRYVVYREMMSDLFLRMFKGVTLTSIKWSYDVRRSHV